MHLYSVLFLNVWLFNAISVAAELDDQPYRYPATRQRGNTN